MLGTHAKARTGARASEREQYRTASRKRIWFRTVVDVKSVSTCRQARRPNRSIRFLMVQHRDRRIGSTAVSARNRKNKRAPEAPGPFCRPGNSQSFDRHISRRPQRSQESCQRPAHEIGVRMEELATEPVVRRDCDRGRPLLTPRHSSALRDRSSATVSSTLDQRASYPTPFRRRWDTPRAEGASCGNAGRCMPMRESFGGTRRRVSDPDPPTIFDRPLRSSSSGDGAWQSMPVSPHAASA